ncbi:MAG: hypothetical protein LKJ47_04925 [Bifidobacteriaceae bacterium]|jgi:hypothetical protein|nr:hypothetical protein [Bifidobacteriaceae bacterium]
MVNKKPVQDALVPDEATPDMLVGLLPKAQGILKASAAYLAAVRGLMDSKDKKAYIEKWGGKVDPITEVLYDTASLAQKTLDAGLAMETMLSKPLKSREIVMLDDLRHAFEERDDALDSGHVNPTTGEILP